MIHALAQDFNNKSVKEINKSDDVRREIFMAGTIISQQTPNILNAFCRTTFQINNRKLPRGKWYQIKINIPKF